MDNKWRVRLAIINHIPLLAGQLKESFFEEKLSNLCTDWLGDSVYCIRQAATEKLAMLADVFGPDWVEKHILPKVIIHSQSQSYLFRMTALHAFMELAKKCGKERTSNLILPAMIRMASDTVPNVRFNVAKMLKTMLPFVQPEAVKVSHIHVFWVFVLGFSSVSHFIFVGYFLLLSFIYLPLFFIKKN